MMWCLVKYTIHIYGRYLVKYRIRLHDVVVS
jgi:hypothetical protein